jgi:hypothetical protein
MLFTPGKALSLDERVHVRQTPILATFGFAIKQAVGMAIYLAAFTKLPKLLSQSPDLCHPLLFSWGSGTFGASSMSHTFAVTIGALYCSGPDSAPAVTLLGLGLDISCLYLGANVLSGNGIGKLACHLWIGIDPDPALADFKLGCGQAPLCC